MIQPIKPWSDIFIDSISDKHCVKHFTLFIFRATKKNFGRKGFTLSYFFHLKRIMEVNVVFKKLKAQTNTSFNTEIPKE